MFTMVRKSVLWLLAGVITVAAAQGLAAWWRIRAEVGDYSCGASGSVLGEHGKPLAGVAVNIFFDKEVFEAITPLRAARTVTDEKGRFALIYISCGNPGPRYRITFEKGGYEKVEQVAQEWGHHRVVMRRARQGLPRPSPSSRVT